ncbi:MAG: family 10 glycosylhydrolase [Acidobacteria bacterium]|nr:family 10 glycosylhydrolase [Acidobacteriota bacterium]
MKKLYCGILTLFFSLCAYGQPTAQYRGFWVDTFNTALNNHNDVVKVISECRAARCNALFVQVRRRGDSWYRNSLEPLADRTPIEAGFDPLADLIREAHTNAIEVHAFVIIGAIWNGNPTATPPRLPEDPRHAFNQHGFNANTGKLYEGRDNWLTRTLLPDDSTISFNGHRLGNDFWIDLGHPDAAAYTHDVLLHLVRNYDLDGLHLDRIRYPDFSGTLNGGVSSGYNETSVARFKRRYGITDAAPPATNDARWQQWRRDQVTNFVRSVYLNAIAIKPRIVISAATIVYGGGPTTEAAWANAEAYWRVFQDWRAWMEEGILDLNVPMNYKREHTASNVPLLDTWAEYLKNHSYDRVTAHGLGVYLNSIEGTLRQIRKAVAPSARGNLSSGVVFFSHANTNEAVTANPLSLPTANRDTPRRSFAEFAAALTTGKSVDGATLYEDTAANPNAVFAQVASAPVLSWKANPMTGHLMGKVLAETSLIPFDSVEVTITRAGDGTPHPVRGRLQVKTPTDGNGFYGAVDLAPGQYVVAFTPMSGVRFNAPSLFTIETGRVTEADIRLPANPLFSSFTTVSAASYSERAVAPGSMAAGFGANLASMVGVANSLPLPVELAGASVSIADSRGVIHRAGLFFVSPNQINFLIPDEAALGFARIGIGRGVLNLNLDRVAPGLFSANGNGQGVAVAFARRVKADGSFVNEAIAQFDAAQNRFVPLAIDLGSANEQVFLILYGTGFKRRSDLAQVQAHLGGLSAEVLYAGAQGELAGLDQLNLLLPRALAGRGDVTVTLMADGFPSNAVQIRIK